MKWKRNANDTCFYFWGKFRNSFTTNLLILNYIHLHFSFVTLLEWGCTNQNRILVWFKNVYVYCLILNSVVYVKWLLYNIIIKSTLILYKYLIFCLKTSWKNTNKQIISNYYYVILTYACASLLVNYSM